MKNANMRVRDLIELLEKVPENYWVQDETTAEYVTGIQVDEDSQQVLI